MPENLWNVIGLSQMKDGTNFWHARNIAEMYTLAVSIFFKDKECSEEYNYKSLQLLFTEPSTNMVITSIGFIRNHCLTCSPFHMGWLKNTRTWEMVPSWLRSQYQNWES